MAELRVRPGYLPDGAGMPFDVLDCDLDKRCEARPTP